MWRVVGLIAFVFLVFVVAMALTKKIAYGHDWYEKSCCSNGDCQLAPLGSVEVTDRGWLVRRGTRNPKGVVLQRDVIVPFGDKKVRSLPHGVAPGLHICTSSGTVYCIYLDGGI